ncbi:MAG: SRPBCC family protein [Actinoallomurus sp.]
MGSVTESVDVDVPVHIAYNQWTQFADFPKFMEGVEKVNQITATMTHWVVKVAGVTTEFDAQITEQIPDERVAWHSIEGPGHAGVVTFHRTSEGTTRVIARMDVDPEGFVENVADKAGLLKLRTRADLKRFKEFIEGRGRETGAWRGSVDRAKP